MSDFFNHTRRNAIQKSSIAVSTGYGTLYIKEAMNINGKKIITWDNCFIAGEKIVIGITCE
jgi:hypothetical protein